MNPDDPFAYAPRSFTHKCRHCGRPIRRTNNGWGDGFFVFCERSARHQPEYPETLETVLSDLQQIEERLR